MAELTEARKEAIRKSWALVNTDLKGNGIAFLMAFFKAHPEYKDIFRHFRGTSLEDLKDTPMLKAHAAIIMHSLSSIVANIDDLGVLVEILKKTGRDHWDRGVRIEQFENLFVVLLAFLQEGLGAQFTAEMKEAWEVATTIMKAVIGEGLGEGAVASSKTS